MLGKKNIKMTLVGVYVWRKKAYLPVKAQYESGIFVDVDPVYIVELNEEKLIHAIQTVKNAGHARLPDPKTREEFLQTHKEVVLPATGAHSWKQLAKTGASYSVSWTDHGVRIEMSRLDKQGRWEFDPDKRKILSPDSSLEEIAKIILEDIKTRPEIFQ